MSDVEKYGLFALVFVVGVLGLILIYGGDDGRDAADGSPAPVVIRQPSEALVPPARSSGNGPRVLNGARNGLANRPGEGPALQHRTGNRSPTQREAQRSRPMRAFKVESLVAGKGPFQFSEPPVAYPGERSVSPRIASSNGRVFHTIGAAETLSDVSKRFFGTTTRWRDILALNPGLDPRRLQVGDTIVIQGPAAAPERVLAQATPRPVAVGSSSRKPRKQSATPAKSNAGAKTYLVKQGDTLGAIAQRELGSVRQSGKLFQANKDLLKSPDKLKPGMKLRIP